MPVVTIKDATGTKVEKDAMDTEKRKDRELDESTDTGSGSVTLKKARTGVDSAEQRPSDFPPLEPAPKMPQMYFPVEFTSRLDLPEIAIGPVIPHQMRERREENIRKLEPHPAQTNIPCLSDLFPGEVIA